MTLALWSLAFVSFASPVSANLQPPAGEQLKQHVHATGDQVYECDGAKWTLYGPDAKLFNEAGTSVGAHFKGPTWQWSDGSQVTGKPVANATPDADSIPWLLLTATGHTGDGVMKSVSSIQRLETKGGKAPATGCDAAHKGERTRVPYTAEYYFFGN